VPRSRSRERITQGFRILGGCFTLFTQTGDVCLQRGRLLLQRAMLRVGRFPVKGRTFGVVANLNRRLQQRGFAGLQLLQRRCLVHEGFFEEDGVVWAADGTVLAQSRQLAILLPSIG